MRKEDGGKHDRRTVLKTMAAGSAGSTLAGVGAAAPGSRSGGQASSSSVDPEEALKGKRVYRGEGIRANDTIPVPNTAEAVDSIGDADVAVLEDDPAVSKDEVVPAINSGTLVAFNGNASATALRSMLGISETDSEAVIREKLQALDLLVAFNWNTLDVPLTVFAPALGPGTLNTHYYNVSTDPETLLTKVAKTVKLNEGPTRNPHSNSVAGTGGVDR